MCDYGLDGVRENVWGCVVGSLEKGAGAERGEQRLLTSIKDRNLPRRSSDHGLGTNKRDRDCSISKTACLVFYK